MSVGAAVLDTHACHLGEGPTYDPVADRLFWFDIVEKKLFEHELRAGRTTVHDLPVMASALAMVDGDRQLLAAETGLWLRDRVGGALSPVVEIEADDPLTRSNDARVHPCGAFWIGTMGKAAERKAGSIYWYFRGELRRLYGEITIPNSICFSPDGSTAYFADTMKNILFRVDCDPATGLPSSEPSVFFDWRRGEGGLDGSVTDRDGLLWNARWGAGSVDAYDASGKRIRSVAVPARQPSCPAFVGGDLSRMAVTSAWQDMDEAARAADPMAGMTFLLPGAFRGKPEPRVAL